VINNLSFGVHYFCDSRMSSCLVLKHKQEIVPHILVFTCTKNQRCFCSLHDIVCGCMLHYLLYQKRVTGSWKICENAKLGTSHLENGTKEKGLMSIKECGIQPWIGPSILPLTIPQSITRSIFVFYTAARCFMKNKNTIYSRFWVVTLLQKYIKHSQTTKSN